MEFQYIILKNLKNTWSDQLSVYSQSTAANLADLFGFELEGTLRMFESVASRVTRTVS